MTTHHHIKSLLTSLGEDSSREGLLETPRRYLEFWQEFTHPPDVTYTTFDSEGYDEMIIQSNITFYSLCEHHLLPIFGTGTIAYIPDTKIIGLSKLARTLEFYSGRLQNQERLTKQVAEKIHSVLAPKGVAVTLHARHLCMEMRGVRQPETYTTTSRLLGVFKTRPETRNEFLQLATFYARSER